MTRARVTVCLVWLAVWTAGLLAAASIGEGAPAGASRPPALGTLAFSVEGRPGFFRVLTDRSAPVVMGRAFTDLHAYDRRGRPFRQSWLAGPRAYVFTDRRGRARVAFDRLNRTWYPLRGTVVLVGWRA